jgi:glycyl-tRNA synthetase alpha subunit
MKRVRDLAVGCAKAYVESREKLGFPLLQKEEAVEVVDAR